MKTHKYKALLFRTERGNAKLIFQWIRKGDSEITLIVTKGDFKRLSGYFAIGDTKSEALALLRVICHKNLLNEEVRLIPWIKLIAKFKNEEQAGVV